MPMDQKTQKFATDVVRCKNWRWIPGMVWISPGGSSGRVVLDWIPDNNSFPDLTDPATLGCLLFLVRQARKEPNWFPTELFDGAETAWVIEQPSPTRQTRYDSEISALVAALFVAK